MKKILSLLILIPTICSAFYIDKKDPGSIFIAEVINIDQSTVSHQFIDAQTGTRIFKLDKASITHDWDEYGEMGIVFRDHFNRKFILDIYRKKLTNPLGEHSLSTIQGNLSFQLFTQYVLKSQSDEKIINSYYTFKNQIMKLVGSTKAVQENDETCSLKVTIKFSLLTERILSIDKKKHCFDGEEY